MLSLCGGGGVGCCACNSHVAAVVVVVTATPAVAAGQGLTGGWIGEEWDLGIEIVIFPIRAKVAALTAPSLPLLVGEAEVGTKTAALL